jgi:hypothetical protein
MTIGGSPDASKYATQLQNRVSNWLDQSSDWGANSEASIQTATTMQNGFAAARNPQVRPRPGVYGASCKAKPEKYSVDPPGSQAKQIAKQANAAFKRKDYPQAAALYSHALEAGSPSYSVPARVRWLRL